MDYGRIVNKSFEVAWRFKSLWILGLFAGGTVTGFNWPGKLTERLGLEDVDLNIRHLGLDFWDFSIPKELIISLLIWLFLIGLLFLIMHFVGVAGLIDGANKITRGGRYRLGDSFATGFRHFWQFLALGVGLFFLIFGFIVFTVLFMVLLFKMHTVLGILGLMFVVPIIFCFAVTSGNIYSLAQRSLVVRGASIGDALEEGYRLFRYNIGKNIVIFLIDIGLSIGLWLLAMIVWGIIGIPIAAVVLASGLGWVAAIFLGLLLGLPVSLVVGGFTGTVLTNLYTLFYFELLEPHRTQPAASPSRPGPGTA
ncbi:MAG: hypothetical protein OEW00_08510 [candidate division Zixibacteria bacterium]|nr:hypothetical protein [candidate division Zixibacteria bacterium]